MQLYSSDPELNEKRFLKALKEGATRLPQRSNSVMSAIYRQLNRRHLKKLAKRCATETGLTNKQLGFLLEDFKAQTTNDKSFQESKDAWAAKLRALPAQNSGRPRVCVLIADGQATRTFLLTDVCRKLASWADLAILSPLDLSEEVRALGPSAIFLPIPSVRRVRFDTLTSYLGYRFTDSPTAAQFLFRLEENFLKAKRGELDGGLKVWRVGRQLQTLDDYRKIYLWSLRFFAHMVSLKDVAEMLRSLKPDLVLNTSSVSWSSRPWSRGAALAGIPVISNVISWDNMSTKTLFDEMSQSYLIWSQEMDDDCAAGLPFVRDKPRTVVGSPQFEPIVQGRGLVPRDEFRRRYGLSPEKKLILYTTGSKSLFPREPDCLDAVLTHWRENLRDRADIMVRMHPKDRQGRYKAVMAKFPDVPFTLAGETLAQDDDWLPTRDDIDLLVNQLHHCDVIVNVASTMTLEGFAIDKPAINIGFTLGRSASQRYPMDDYYHSRHYRDIVETGAARLVANYEELFEAIDAVLDRGEFDVERQRAALRMKCMYTEDASERILVAIQKFASDRSRS